MAVHESIQLHQGILYDRLPDLRARCNVCQRRCVIAPERMGVCMTRLNKGGDVFSTIYGIVSSMAADPIEKKPLYHYLPGSRSFSLGSFGCNFRCVFCQNWEIAYADGTQIPAVAGRYISPERAVQMARENRCATISWTYNEPAIWIEYILDSARLAKKYGLGTIYVTNGYATPEHLDAIGPYLDVYRVDIKSFSDDFYRKLINVPGVQGILDVARIAKDRWKMHVEAVTNVIPTWNDDPDNLRAIARWIKDNLGDLTPWHVTRFFPCAQLTNVPPTPLETLEKARTIGLEEGLKFVYVGNVASGDQNTYCPACHTLVVSRFGYSTQVHALTENGTCASCGADLGIVMSPRS